MMFLILSASIASIIILHSQQASMYSYNATLYMVIEVVATSVLASALCYIII